MSNLSITRIYKLKRIADYLFGLPVIVRRGFFLLIDFLALLICFYFTFSIFEILIPFSDVFNIKNGIILFTFFFLINYFTGQYNGLTLYSGSSSIYKLALRNLLISITIFFIIYSSKIIGFNISFYIVNWVLITFVIGSIRIILRDFFLLITKKFLYESNVIIYGAGELGVQLYSALRFNSNKRVVSFLDDDKKLWGRNIFGCVINEPKAIDQLLKKYKIKEVILALPSLTDLSKNRILNILENYNIKISQIQSLNNFTGTPVDLKSLKPLSIEQLLGRTPVKPDKKLLNDAVKNKKILITGAGGSIGSELCRQIIDLYPNEISIVDNSEASLYQIDNELKKFNKLGVTIRTILGDVSNETFINKIVQDTGAEVIYHACAYKHVPLVEINPISAIKNNIFSTYNLVKASLNSKVEKFILISSDKAVRPKNIMGLTKRVSELIIYEFSKEKYHQYKSKAKVFSIVRFGNVLGSSGSVVPLFKKQIADGGPVTITDPEVIRYFMTINEASQLVIQSSSLAVGGDLFILDMGKPIKILNLAKQMIKLSGKKVKSRASDKDAIEIKFTGLRMGEKLFEELLINEKNSIRTNHPLIFKGDESSTHSVDMKRIMEDLKYAIDEYNLVKCLNLISELVPEWKQ